jgi:lipooligosaccharide transport system permease protein
MLLLPRSVRPTRRVSRVIEREVVVAQAVWIYLVSGFFEPVFFLLSIGVGIGHLVGRVPVEHHLVPYRDFVAPAMLASSAMNGAVFSTTFTIFFKLKFQKTFDAMVATPLGVGDIVMGQVGWAMIRGTFYSVAFLGVMLGLGLVHSWWAILVPPAAVLIVFAFAGVGMAGTSFMRTWQDFDFVTLALLPLFLFSGTFSPLGAYPPVVRLIVKATPLYQGVAICRGLVLGHVGPVLLAHALYLALAGTIGVVVASRRFGRLLLG